MPEDTRYAGFWTRMIADFVDSLLIDSATFLVVLMTMGAVYWIQILFGSSGTTPPSFMEVLSSIWLQVFLMLVRGCFSLAYFGWGTFRYGTTLGKRMLGIYVVNFISETEHSPITLRQSMMRCFSYIVSYIPFGTGFMMAAFHPQKRALHDLIAGTASIRRG